MDEDDEGALASQRELRSYQQAALYKARSGNIVMVSGTL